MENALREIYIGFVPSYFFFVRAMGKEFLTNFFQTDREVLSGIPNGDVGNEVVVNRLSPFFARASGRLVQHPTQSSKMYV